MSVALSAEAGPRGEPARAILVGVDFGRQQHFDATLDELALLAESAGDVAVARVIARRKAPDAAFFVGSGKADEIKAMVPLHQAEVVVFDQALSPAQQRNLERHLGVAVADRTMLILEIFGERARSHEGKLQVELARLQYLTTRLVRRWSHLERQRGGIGTRGGPGEAQIELDRRMIGERIKAIKKQLEKVKNQRSTQRRAARAQPDLPRLAGRLHQRRQVDAVQRPGQGRRLCRRPAVRHPRHHHAPAAHRARSSAASPCPTRSASSATCRTR